MSAGKPLGILQINLDPDAADPRKREQETGEEEERQKDGLGAMLSGRFEEWKTVKRMVEEEWLKDLRAFNCQFEPDSDDDGEQVYYGITRTKCLAAYARITDLLFQSGDKHWAIHQTPVPEDELGRSHVFTDPETGLPQELNDEQFQELMEIRAELMEREMDDQLTESGYDRHLKSAILEMCVLGSGAMKGVVLGIDRDRRWRRLPTGWEIITSEKPAPKISHVSVFNLYPDPYATDISEAVGVFERHVITRSELRELSRDERFDSDVIDDLLLNSGQNGSHVDEYHEIERRRISGYAATSISESSRFDVLEYWGWVAGRDLEARGLDVDRDREYFVNAWICGSRTLMVEIMDGEMERVPYQIAPYYKVPHSIWGVGIARMMRDSQAVMNATIREMIDNLSLSAGPMAEVNVKMLAPGQDPHRMKRRQVFLRDSGDPAYPAVRFFQPQSNVGMLTQVLDLFRRAADEETGLPSYTHGQQIPGLNKTASGMSMLMSAANMNIKVVVRNIDDYLVRPLLQSLYDWNMKWNPKEEIKGDLEVDARGSTALIAKEVQSQRLVEFLNLTANPVDMQIVDRRALLKAVAESMDINPERIMRDDDMGGQGFAGTPDVAVQQPAVAGNGGGVDAITGSVPGQPGGIEQSA